MEELILNIETDDGGKLRIIKMSEDIEYLIKEIKNFNDYLEEFHEIKTNKRKLEFLNVRLGLNKMFEKELIVRYNANGKPFVEAEFSNISISHSGNLIALYSHPTLHSGVDVEKISSKALRVCNKFLTEEEQSEIGCENPELNYLLAWSAKEALYKIIGIDAVDFREQLKIFAFGNEHEGKMKLLHIPSGQLYYPEFKIYNEFVVVFCNG